MAATYPADIARRFADFLVTGGLDVVRTRGHDIETAAEAGTLGGKEVCRMAAANDTPDAEAILLPDTAMHTASYLDELENACAKPVLTANQVTVWTGLRLVGRHEPHPALGRLFRLPAQRGTCTGGGPRLGSPPATSAYPSAEDGDTILSESDDLQPVSRETTAGFIAGQIRQGIMSGTFPPGCQLGEADLANRFEVSRGPLREAMQRLVQEGLLHSERHRGLFVTTLDTDSILDVYLARSAVERTAVSEVVRRANPDDLQPLQEAVANMDAAVESGEWSALADADLAFHEALVAAAGSVRLVRMNSTLLVETRMCLSMLEPLYAFPVDLADEHRGILEALRLGDERTALKLLDAHMDDARDKRVRWAREVDAEGSLDGG